MDLDKAIGELWQKYLTMTPSDFLDENYEDEERHGLCCRQVRLPVDELPNPKPHLPNLNAPNPSFAARLLIYIRDRFNNSASTIYKAAGLTRQD